MPLPRVVDPLYVLSTGNGEIYVFRMGDGRYLAIELTDDCEIRFLEASSLDELAHLAMCSYADIPPWNRVSDVGEALALARRIIEIARLPKERVEEMASKYVADSDVPKLFYAIRKLLEENRDRVEQLCRSR